MMKRTSAWFLRELRKQVKTKPNRPVRFDVDWECELKEVQKAATELRRIDASGRPGQWSLAFSEHPDKSKHKLKRIAFLGPDAPRPIKFIKGPRIGPYKADETARPAAEQEPAQPRTTRVPLKSSFILERGGERITVPVQEIQRIIDSVPPNVRKQEDAEIAAAHEELERLRKKYTPDYHVEIGHGNGASVSLSRYYFEVWRGEDWLAVHYATLYPTEIAHLLATGEGARFTAKMMEPMFEKGVAMVRRNRSNAPLGGKARGRCTDDQIVTAFREYKRRNSMHSYAAAEMTVADNLGYSLHRKLGERVHRMKGIPPAEWYKTQL